MLFLGSPLQGKRSPYKIARDYDVTHAAIYNIWKSERNQRLFECKIQADILKKIATIIKNDSDFLLQIRTVEWDDFERGVLKNLKIVEEV